MSARKRHRDENTPVTPRSQPHTTFVDCSAPKKPRLSAKKAREFSSQDIQNIEKDRVLREAQRVVEETERDKLEADRQDKLAVERVEAVWNCIRGEGCVIIWICAGPVDHQGSCPFCSSYTNAHLSWKSACSLSLVMTMLLNSKQPLACTFSCAARLDRFSMYSIMRDSHCHILRPSRIIMLMLLILFASRLVHAGGFHRKSPRHELPC
jgi:hypothetical protein